MRRPLAPWLLAILTTPTLAAAQGEPPDEPVERPAIEAAVPSDGVALGSYGRVGFGTDTDGSTAEAANVVTHGSRVVEPTYLELDLYYRTTRDGTRITTVSTLGFADNLLHQSGEFDSTLALRNLYVEASRGANGVWAGSRMVRGDDIYLLDYWPLDDLNTVGAGGFITRGPVRTELTIGVNRLLDPFQFQQRDVMTPGSVGSESIAQLDRQRFIAAVKSTATLPRQVGDMGFKASVYVEAQALPDGEREREDQTIEELPSDAGVSLGLQLGAFDFGQVGRGNHANLFIRYSRGLSAFDELAAPTGLDRDKRAIGASELVVGSSASLAHGRFGLLAGGYSRRFVDADPNTADRDDGWEYIVDARPFARVAGPVGVAVDASYQVRLPRGISPTTLTAMDPAVFQIAPMLLYTPFGDGAFARPQIRLVYRAAHQNDGARDLYPLEDPRRSRTWAHTVGVSAEWWFNSTYR